MSKENVSSQEDSQPDRRDFIKGASCVIGAAIGAVPMAAGVRVVLDPLSRQSTKEGDAEFIRLADVSDLPMGEPMKFAIVEDKKDKWSRYKDVPVGAVYLLNEIRDGDNDGVPVEVSVIAYNTVCPHLGCFVDYRKDEQDFFCPCHDSNFDLEGNLLKGVSPRGMDTLEVDEEKLKAGEVWVKFQRFKGNTKEKIVL
jgi:Rieske Fe-S protein